MSGLETDSDLAYDIHKADDRYTRLTGADLVVQMYRDATKGVATVTFTDGTVFQGSMMDTLRDAREFARARLADASGEQGT